jgi:4-amino-4-deoxy-L-arabinose transferase-like glycosyltransferase
LPSIGITVAASLCVRLVMSAMHGYGVDEAYAITVAAPLSLSYFDHPPLTFWLAALSSQLWESNAPFLLRLPFVLLFTLTHWCIGQLTRYAFSDRAGRIAALALALSGILGIVDGMWVLPDGPLIAFASLGCLVLAPVLLARAPDGDASSNGRWLVAGAAFGMAGLAKYHAALLVAGLFTFLLTDVRSRRLLRTRGPWMALGVTLLFACPVVVWNARHGWASFAFQSARAEPRGFSVVPLLENVAGQAAWMLPWIFVPLAVAWIAAVRRGRADREAWFFVCLTAWPVILFTLVTLGGSRGLPHWQAPGWLFAFPLLGFAADQAAHAGARWPRIWARASAATTLGVVALLMVFLRVPSVARRLDLPPQGDPASDLVSWEPVVAAITRGNAINANTVVAARSWIQAGQLGASFVSAPTIRCLCADPHHFPWRSPADTAWSALIVADRLQPWRRGWLPVERAFADSTWHIVPLDTVRLERGVQVALYRIVRAQPGAN